MKDGMSCSYVVARYKPAGNAKGEYKKNVLKGRFSKDMCYNLDGITKVEPSDSTDSVEGDTSDLPNFSVDIRDSPGVRFDQNGLKAHNYLRAIHGSIEMKIDPNLSKDAELYAKELTRVDTLQHSIKRNKAGESLTYACTPEKNYQLSATETTKRW